MAKSRKQMIAECIAEAQGALHTFDKDDLHSFINDIYDRAQEIENNNIPKTAALKEALKEKKSDMRSILLSDCAIKAQDIEIFNNNSNLMKEKNLKQADLIMENVKNKTFNLEQSIRTSIDERYNYAHEGLSEEEIAYWQDGEFDEDIANAFDGRAYTNPMSKVIAEKMRNVIRNNSEARISAGVMRIDEMNPNRFFGAVYDAEKLLSGGVTGLKKVFNLLSGQRITPADAVNKWDNSIKNFVNIKETFKKTSAYDVALNEADSKQITKINQNAFEGISEDRSSIFTKSSVKNNKEALQRRRRMFYVYKDMASYHEMSKLYGTGSLYQDMLRDTYKAGREIGIAKQYGSNPYNMFDDLRSYEEKLNKLNKNVPGFKPTSNYQRRKAESAFNNIMGVNNTTAAPAIKNFIANNQKISQMNALGSLIVYSLDDSKNNALLAMRHGGFFHEGIVNTFLAMFGNMGLSQEQKILMAKLMRRDLQDHMGMVARHTDFTNTSSVLDKASNKFFTLNMTRAWDNGMKSGAFRTIASLYGRAAKLSFEKLNDQSRHILGTFGIDADEWNLLRTKTSHGWFTTDVIDKLSDTELKDLWERKGKPVALKDYSNFLFRKVHAIFDSGQAIAVTRPGVFEKVIVTGNQTGIPGQAWRAFWQFKSYPIAFIRRNFVEAMKDLVGPQRKIMYATAVLASSSALAYASTWLGYYIRGLTMPSFDEMSTGDRIQFLTSVLIPGLGVFANIIDPKRENVDFFASLFYGKTFRLMSAEVSTILGAGQYAIDPEQREKDLKDTLFMRNLKNVVRHANPVQSLPFIEPYMDKLMGKEPYLKPGQEQLDWAKS